MMLSIVKASGRRPGAAWGSRVVDAGLRLAAALAAVRRAAAERSELLALGERELRDIGISRADAIREADRPLWNWRVE